LNKTEIMNTHLHLFLQSMLRQSLLSLLLIFMAMRAHSQDTIIQVSSGKLHRYYSLASQFVATRTIDIWIPSDYNSRKKYDLIVMQDGQNLFESEWTGSPSKPVWNVDDCLTLLKKEKQIKPTIVVGIWNTQNRRPEYFPQKAYESLPDSVRQKVKEDIKGDAISDLYLKFITTELLPFVQSHYAVYRDKKHTTIMGSSMGGLISMYAVCEYPEIFGTAVCMSNHWVGCPNYRNAVIPETFIAYLKNNLPSLNDHRFYFDAGTETLDALYGPWLLLAESSARPKKRLEKNWCFKKYPGEAHHETSWSKRLPDVMKYAVGK